MQPHLISGEEVVLKKKKSTCSVCESGNLAKVLDLPKFPMTGIFVSSPTEAESYRTDQGLMLCRECGHGQLQYCLDPEFVYGATYSHRSSTSDIARRGNNFFLRFVDELMGQRQFKRIIEVGCNDLYLLQKMEPKGENLIGIDPIWQGKEGQVTEKIKVSGKFIEDLDLVEELQGKPDLILSAHTFEHMNNPKEQLKKLMEVAADGALFVIEVPGFDSLLTHCRFDQVFHQHIHYFSLASFRSLLDAVGAEYLRHTFNYDYWGGTMLVAFRKGTSRSTARSVKESPIANEELVEKKYQLFYAQMAHLMQQVESPGLSPLYGYGAAQMVPTLAYHMKSNLSFLECIWDDDPRRSNLTYPFLSVWTRCPTEDFTLEGAGVLVTALDSVRPILKRVVALKARHILLPLNLF